MAVNTRTQDARISAGQTMALDARLQMAQALEATEILAKIAEYPPREQENALAFLRGIQFAQGIRPNA